MVRIELKKPKAIILDMDGTTTPVTFLPQKLLPFIKDNIKPFLIKHRNDQLVKDLVSKLREELRSDENAPHIPESNGENEEQVFRKVVACVTYIISERKKSPVFLAFNILITLDGYKTKQLQGEVFEDVPDALHIWKKVLKIHTYIYSSGIIESQQMHFAVSTRFNLDVLIDGYLSSKDFGQKTDPESWPKVANRINAKTQDMLFFTDNPKEARAAKKAGVRSLLIRRPHNKKLTAEEMSEFVTVDSLTDVEFRL